MTDSDSEYEVEEKMVMMELSGIIDANFLGVNEDKPCKIVDIETEKPILQIGDYVFSGEYKTPIGSLVLFEEVDGPTKKDDGSGDDRSLKQLKYTCVSDKRLVMKRAFLSDDAKSSKTSEDPKE